MSRRAYLYLLLTMLVLIVGIFPGTSAAAAKRSYIVVLKDSVQAPAKVAASQLVGHGGKLGYVYRYAIKGYYAELTATAVDELRRDPRVKYVVVAGRVSIAEEEEV